MSGLGYRRSDLQRLAEAKLEDSQLLIRHGRASSSYYLLGYVVELALKACIARQFRADTIPDPDLGRRVYTHKTVDLIGLAGLAAELKLKRGDDPIFSSNWSTISEWSESIRYETVDMASAQSMYDAVADPEHGVLVWLKRFW